MTLERLNAAGGDGKVELRASAQDQSPVSRVAFFRGDTKIGEATNFPFTFSYSLQPGDSPSVSFTAEAVDVAGNAGRSAALVVETSPPSVTLARAPAGTITSSQTVTFTATATDAQSGIARVEFLKGAAKLGEATTAPYQQAYTVTKADEPSFTVTARAVDGAGNVATASVTVPVNIGANDPVAPTVLLDELPNPITTGRLELAATADDNVGVAKVEFYKDDVLLGEASSRTADKYRFTTTVAANGPVTFKAVAYDAAGNTAASSRSSVAQLLLVHVGGGVAGRFPDVSGCAPAVAFAADGTAFMTSKGAGGTEVRVAKLVNDVWQPLGGAVNDSGTTSGGGLCPQLAVDQAGVPHVAFVQSTSAGAVVLRVRRFTVGGAWEEVGVLSVAADASTRFSFLIDSTGRPVLAVCGVAGAGGEVRLLRFADGSWSAVTAPFMDSVRDVKLALRSDDNPVVAYQRNVGGGATNVSVGQVVGGAFSVLGSVDTTPDSTHIQTLRDLDVDANNTVVTVHRNAQGGFNQVVTKRFEAASFVLVGTAAEQPTDALGGSTVLLDGNPVQVFQPLGSVLHARRWTGSAWTAPLALPIDAGEGAVTRFGAQAFVGYVFLSPAPSAVILAKLNVP